MDEETESASTPSLNELVCKSSCYCPRISQNNGVLDNLQITDSHDVTNEVTNTQDEITRVSGTDPFSELNDIESVTLLNDQLFAEKTRTKNLTSNNHKLLSQNMFSSL